jgi:hypothetical protein
MAKRDLPKPRKATASTLRIWSAVRQLRRFTTDDLVAVTECKAGIVNMKLWLWRCHGIVHQDNDGFRLAVDCGPTPPWRRAELGDGLVNGLTGELLKRVRLKSREAAPKASRTTGRGKGTIYTTPQAKRDRINFMRRQRRRRSKAGQSSR